MNEEELLKKFAKALGAEDTLDKIEQKKIKQEKMLKGMAKLLGTEDLLEEIETKKAREQAAIEEKREKERKLLEQMNAALSRLVENNPEHAPIIEQEVAETIEEVVAVAQVEEEPVVVSEDLQPMPELPVDDIVTQAVKDLSKTAPKNIQKEVDKLPDGVRKELDILKKSIADLHRFAQRHSQMGGGGEVNLRYLDDVNANTIADGLYLRYDAPTRKFVFDTPSGGGGYTLPTASTTVLGGVKIDGNTIVIAANGVISANIASGNGGPYSYLISADSTQIANLDNSGVLSIPGNIIPQTNLAYSLGNTTNRFDSMWVGSNSITFTDLNSSFPDQKLSLSNGVFYIAIANSTAQSNAGFRVGNFLLQNNYIALTNSSAEFFIGTEPATGNLVINRPIVVYAVGTNNTPTFTVSRSGEVQIFTANIQANKQSLSIIGSSDGSTQSVGLAGRMIHVTGNDGSPSRIENDAFGTGAFASYIGRSGRGTANTPSATQNTDTIARFAALGWGTTNFLATNVGSGPPINSIDFVATENYTDSNAGSKLVIYTSPNGSRVRTLSLTVNSTGITANNATLYSITANGSLGTSGQVLTTNGSSVFWGTASGGANGANGVGITNAAVNGNGYLIITYSNTTTANAGYVVGSNGATGATGANGANGATGANGISITSSVVNSNGYLTITYSNTYVANAGYVVGSQGPKGDTGNTGANGATGNTGPAGANGANGTNGSNGISITNTAINANGDLIITYSNTSTANAGHVIPTYSVSYGNSINGGNLALSGNTFTFYPANLTPYATNSYVNSTFVTNTVYQNNHYLSNLYDVSITGAQNNQVLTYSSAISKWINQNITTNTYTTGYYGSFYYSGANVALSNTENVYIVPLQGSYDGTSGVTLGTNNDITFAYSGTYEIVYSIQYENSGNSDDLVDVWLRKNGVDIDNTNSIYDINRKSTSNNPSQLIAVTPFQVTLNAGDKIQVATTSSTGNVKLASFPAQTGPNVPATPAVIVNVEQVASVVTPVNITGSSNNASYLGGYAANQYAYANSLSAYQTTAGLFANVATLAANSATYLNGNTASDLRTYASNLAGNAYSNAISYSGNAALAYSNAVSTAATDASNKAGNAYSNAVAYAASNTTVYSTFAQNTSVYSTFAQNTSVYSTFAQNSAVAQLSSNNSLTGNQYFQGTNNYFSSKLFVGANVFINATHIAVSTNATMNLVMTANQITLNGSNVITNATVMKVYYANGTQAYP